MFEKWFGRRAEREEVLLRTIEKLVENNTKSQEALLAAVNKVTETQAKQLEAIGTHLSLFKTVEAPSASALSGEADAKAWADQNEFPWGGTPQEQAEWIATHDEMD